MAGATTSSSYLPTIKCSSCNVDIEISFMGSHICAQTHPTSYQQSERFNNGYPSMHTKLVHGSGSTKPGRMPPPRMDLTAASRPSLRPGTSLSHNEHSRSPLTSGNGRKSPFRPPPRSATAPLPYQPPSPDIPLAQDCAFPVFPTTGSRNGSPTTRKDQNRSSSTGRSRSQAENHTRIHAPVSTRKDSGHNVLQKMNTIAPGPFNVTRNGSDDGSSAHKRTATMGSANGLSSPPRTRTPVARPSTSGNDQVRKGSMSSLSGGLRSGFIGTERVEPPMLSPPFSMRYSRPDEANVVPPGPAKASHNPAVDPLRLESRSQTFPGDGQSQSTAMTPTQQLPRRPSEPPSAYHPRRPSVSAANRPLYEIGSMSSYKPPRPTESRSASPMNGLIDRSDPRHADAPPVPIPTRADDFNVRNPTHASIESTSSNGSANSDANTSSSRSSPPLSGSPYRPSRKESDNIDTLMNDIQTSMGQATVKEEAPYVSRGPARSFSRPMYARAAETQVETPESPMDPAMHNSRISPPPPPPASGRPTPSATNSDPSQTYPVQVQRHYSPPQPLYVQPPTTAPLQQHPLPSRNAAKPYPSSTPKSMALPSEKSQNLLPGRRATTANKGNCRGCSELIQGKSVSSADGRLTGRYHKQCFVCQTCKEPFQTADFYVINNQPYCCQHYHALNGSLCKACDKGIEGQYLETEVKLKFHPHCFTCHDCHKILRDGYYEMNGKISCEQHSGRAGHETSLLGPGRRHAERRTTRLMMM